MEKCLFMTKQHFVNFHSSVWIVSDAAEDLLPVIGWVQYEHAHGQI